MGRFLQLLENVIRHGFSLHPDYTENRINRTFYRLFSNGTIGKGEDPQTQLQRGVDLPESRRSFLPHFPAHNIYADPSKENRVSKHHIGAEVDFYLQGMEERPQEVVGLIMQYFQEAPAYRSDKENQEFKRFDKTELAVQPWMNKEIFVKL